ncbi:MAG: hypothetical protein HYU36_01885 [Planctomycetes bacterium]|nr:hypothetical protein [Planctomycetota bacterium]
MPFLLALSLFASPASAAPGDVWSDSRPEDFSKGKLEGVTVSAAGELALGPKRTILLKDDRAALIWSLAVDSKGTVYAGSGHQGILFKITPDKTEVVWDSDDPEVTSLAVDSQDNVYAAIAPSGRIFQISPQGQAQLHAETGQAYVWSMDVTAQGEIYAATGPEGKILKIGINHDISTVYDSQDAHVLCLARARDGRLFAGTAGRGLVYEINQGKASTLYDADLGEIRCMALDDDQRLIFATASGAQIPTGPLPGVKGVQAGAAAAPAGGGEAAAQGNESQPTLPAPDRAAAQQAGEAGEAESKPEATPVPPRSMQRGQGDAGIVIQKTNGIFRQEKQGEFRRIFSLQGGLFYSLALKNETLYAGTGPGIGLFRLRGESEAVQITDGAEMTNLLALAIARDGNILVGSGTPGLVHQLSPQFQEKGVFWSQVRDAALVARFGQISWRVASLPGTQATLATRSGNVAEPDETWSPWSEECTHPEGQAVSSPPARFFQYRATLTTAQGDVTPRLLEVRTTYIQNNFPPQITKFQIGAAPAQEKAEKKGETETEKKAPSGRPSTESPGLLPAPLIIEPELGAALRSVSDLSWSASDPNSDTLSYSFAFRLKDDVLWKPIVKRTRDTTFKWDTLLIPDGWYELQLVVDDKESNTESRGLETQLVTPLILVDNSGPGIPEVHPSGVMEGRCLIRVVFLDQFTHVGAVFYSLDGKPWESLPSLDDIYDSQREEVEIDLRDLKPGVHALSILAKDKMGNASIRRLFVPVPEKAK